MIAEEYDRCIIKFFRFRKITQEWRKRVIQVSNDLSCVFISIVQLQLHYLVWIIIFFKKTIGIFERIFRHLMVIKTSSHNRIWSLKKSEFVFRIFVIRITIEWIGFMVSAYTLHEFHLFIRKGNTRIRALITCKSCHKSYSFEVLENALEF